MSKNMYIVSFFIPSFRTLEEAKWNVKVCLSRSEAIKYLNDGNEEIYHFVGDNLESKTPIYCDEKGNVSFGKTRKVEKVIRVV